MVCFYEFESIVLFYALNQSFTMMLCYVLFCSQTKSLWRGGVRETLRRRTLRKSELCSLPMLRPLLNMSQNNKFMFCGCAYNFFYQWACILIFTLECMFEFGRCNTDALELNTTKFYQNQYYVLLNFCFYLYFLKQYYFFLLLLVVARPPHMPCTFEKKNFLIY